MVRFTRHEWRDGAIGRLLREAESKKKDGRRPGITHQDEFDLSVYITPEMKKKRAWASKPLCGRIDELLFDPALDELDQGRADQMVAIILRHRQTVFLCDRVGALQVYAQLAGQQDFTLFILHGVAPGFGQNSSDVFPPRLVAATEGQVLRGQADCVNPLLEGYVKTKAPGSHQAPGAKGQLSDVLGKAIGNFAALAHWDLRPERTASLLASLAWFLDHGGCQYKQGPEDLGASVFGQLTLPALEYSANEWSILLDPSWIAIKKDIQAKAEQGSGAAAYIDINGVMSFFVAQSTDQIGAAREKMFDVMGFIQDRAGEPDTSIQDRIAVVFQSVQH
ncbi:MAG: hypothetical protein HRU33_13040 [Rhodobacteraceae bacterium]|nr:hypothetical protein [Paracoccaceae bacterium]